MQLNDSSVQERAGGSRRARSKRAATTELRTYLSYVAAAWLAVGGAALAQFHFFYGHYSSRLFVVPSLVGIALGLLLGHLAILRKQLRDTRDQFRAVADLGQEFTYLRALDGSYGYVSPACSNVTGYQPPAFYAQPDLMEQLVHKDDLARWRKHDRAATEGQTPQGIDVRLIGHDDREVWVHHLSAPVHDRNGRQTGVRATNLDITERKEHEARIAQMAFFDPLTKLPNRRSLNRQLEESISRANKSGEAFAVLFVDLKRFKNINDCFGHTFGDRVLTQVAERLGRSLGNGSLLSRFGGDEFVILSPDACDRRQARDSAEAILAAIEAPIELDETELHISASIGIALYPHDGDEAGLLIRNADAAMYRTKLQQHSNVGIYSQNLGQEVSNFVSIETRIHRGLEAGEFVPFYQPLLSMRTGEILGVEALARWRQADGGLIAPGEFLSIAEETGQINPMSIQLFKQVFEDLCRWQRRGCAVPVSVNMSARQFAQPDFCDEFVRLIDRAGCDHSLVAVEVTEQVFLGDIGNAVNKLNRLRARGISVSLDDFGTGYSSLTYLKRLPIDTLKIDRSFVADVCQDPTSSAILKAIIALCNDLKLRTVVEGVETEAQAQTLQLLGCDVAQGFLYHRPQPVDEVEKHLFASREA